MLPLYLSIEGFYSYQQKQEINFTELTEAGLFGIFGAVGSGKSSILEAISFVLYGDTERLNKTDKRSYNMLNLKSSQAYIVFDFLNFEGKKHRFTARWKRRASRFEDTSPIERQAYQYIDQQWVPLPSADGSLVTNLSYPNFRRTIIIPQGQFKEFLELKGKERSEMMKEIFQLNKFDLGPKVAHLQSANNKKLENLKGALSGFETISAEILKEKELNLQIENQHLVQAKEIYDQTQVQLQVLREAKERHLELVKKRVEIHELVEQKPRIDQQEKELNRYEHAVHLFREPLSALQNLHAEKEKLTIRVEELHSARKQLRIEIEALTAQLTALSPDYNNLDRYRLEKEDYATLLHILTNKNKLAKEQENLKKGEPYLVQSRLDNEKISSQLQQAEQELTQLKQQRFDTGQLMEIEAWYVTKDTMQHQLDNLNMEEANLNAEIRQLELVFTDQGWDSNRWDQQIKSKYDELNQLLQRLGDEETHLKVQIRLGEFADDLETGQPCPLCGALEHPKPMQSGQALIDLKQNQEKREDLIQEQQQLQQLSNQLNRVSSTLESKQTNLQKTQTAKQQQLDILRAHREKFIWSQYSPDDKTRFGQQKALNLASEQKIRNQEEAIAHLRKALQQKANELAKFEQRIQVIHKDMAIATSLIEKDEKQLRILIVNDFEAQGNDELIRQKQHIEKKIVETEQRYLTITQELHSKQTLLADTSGKYQVSKERFGTLREALAAQHTLIATLLDENNYQDLNEVQMVLAKNLPVMQLRQEIQQFTIRLQVLERQIENLQTMTARDQFTEDRLNEMTSLFLESKQMYESQLSKTGGLEKELAQLAVEYAKKEKLLEEFETINRRAENLKTMENLFRGNGFVNYISTIHMERLCDIANHRFHRLTKNQLSLTVNENNEFEVIDYLNNGYARSVKTLSGGQGFQAALCLALALAENIQSLNKADKNFFFIDEGFGTQDNESINTVFDTLQYLHQENRIVGIISHVEELKERMPRSVTIHKDLDKGSQIQFTY